MKCGGGWGGIKCHTSTDQNVAVCVRPMPGSEGIDLCSVHSSASRSTNRPQRRGLNYYRLLLSERAAPAAIKAYVVPKCRGGEGTTAQCPSVCLPALKHKTND